MTDRKAAPLSATLLARKGSARPAGLHGGMPHDLATEEDQDNTLEPTGAAGFSRSPGDEAPLAPELLSIHPIQTLDGGSTALRAGPRPGSQRLWASDTEVIDLSRKRGMSSRWWLVIAVAIILAATLAASYGRAWGPRDTQDLSEVSSSPVGPPRLLQVGRGAARVTLPPITVSDATRPNADLPTLARDAAQKLATLRAAADRVSAGPRPTRAEVGLTAAMPLGTTPPSEGAATALKRPVLVASPKVVPPDETRDAATRSGISAWLPQRKPEPSQSALLTDGGNGVFVQLGSVKSAAGAMREWDKLVGEFPGVLSGRPLKIERVALANRGDFYRIRTGPIAGLTRARAICAEFVARDRGCLVVRR